MSGTFFANLWSRFLRNQWKILLVTFPAAFATGYVVWRLKLKQQPRTTTNSTGGQDEDDGSSTQATTSAPVPTNPNQPTPDEPLTVDEQPLAGSTLPLPTGSVSTTTINPPPSYPSPTDSGYQGGMPSPPEEPKSSDAEYQSLPPTPCSLPVGASPVNVDTTVIRGGRARATIQLPIDIIGRFIGRTGKNIKSLMSESGAQIHVQQKNLSKEDSVVPCILQGTQAQINKAVDLICLRHPEVSVPSPQVYVTPLPIYSSSLGTNVTSASWDFTLKQPPVPNSIFLAIVTYIEKLNRVWLVPYSSTQLLEELHQSMANSYKTDDATPTGDKDKIVGKSCAVRVNEVYWLRGRVVEVNEESQYEVQLLDYGSSVIVPLSSLRPLRKEHTLIPVQSLPYILSNIQPTNSDGEDGMLVLQALVEGVVLEAHPTGRQSNENTPFIELYTQSQLGSSSDTQTFINRELVNQGFAIWRETTTTAIDSSSPFTSSSDDNIPTSTTTTIPPLATPITHITTTTIATPTVDIPGPGDAAVYTASSSRSVTLSDLLSNKPVITSLAKDHLSDHLSDRHTSVTTTNTLSTPDKQQQQLTDSAPSMVDPMKALFGDQLYTLSHSSS